LEDDGSYLDDEEMAMITQKFKKFFKKERENFKKKSTSKPRSSDRDQFTCCFKCGKHDHIVENCPLRKEENGSEQFQTMAGDHIKIVLQGVSLRQ